MQRTITIAGGGLAGLSLGILLRREAVPVEIWDAGVYPRHRVCGEFVSGRGVAILNSLLPEVSRIGSMAGTVRFFHEDWTSSVFSLPEPALSVDRATLDHALATHFRAIGGVLHENRRLSGPFDREGVVRATGRRPAPDGEPHYVGFKAHARNLRLSANLELHFSGDAYVGLSSQRDGTVNVCGLFRKTNTFRGVDFRNGDGFKQVLSGTTRKAFDDAVLDAESFSAVAAISLKREAGNRTKECRIGDTICMIPPLTGNGMSLAMESAVMAAPFLRDFSHGPADWGETQAKISQACESHFRRRLFAASILQNIAFNATGRCAMTYFLATGRSFFDLWFRLTR